MDSLKYLSDFFDAIKTDGRIGATHIAIYAALVQYRKEREFANPIHAFSREIMEIAKVSSAITYQRCVRALSDYGYLRYEPSFDRTKASRIYFTDHCNKYPTHQ